MKTTKTTKTATEGREKAATKAEALTATKTAEKTTKTTKGKEEETMKTTKKNAANAAKNAPKTEAAAAVKIEDAPKTAEAVKTTAAALTEAAADIMKPEALKALLQAAKTAATPDQRQEARERFNEGREAFNAAALKNAVDRASFMAAAEAFRPDAPKTEAAKKNGVDYERRAERVQYIQVDEEGEAAARFLNLNTYAAEVFMRGLPTNEQVEALEAALKAVDVFLKRNIEEDSHEGLKAAAEALTALCTACGLEAFTKTAEGFNFYVHRSFVLAVAARLKARRGVFMTPNATREEKTAAFLNAAHDKRTKAEAALKKAEAAAVKSVFNIVSEALKAAVYGVFRAEVMTAEDVKKAAALKAAEDAKKTEERAKAAKAKAAAKKTKAEAALKKAEENLKKAEAAEAALKTA